MKKVFFCCLLSVFSLSTMFAQMSDKEVINYVKQEYQNGSSQQQIATNLMKKGVSKEQLERIKTQQENEQKNASTSKSNAKPNSLPSNNNRLRNSNNQTELNIFEYVKLEGDTIVEKSDSLKIQIFGHNIFNNKNLTFDPAVNIATPANYRLGAGDEVIIDIWGASQTTVRETISPDGNIVVDYLGPIYLNGMSIKEANDYVQRKFSTIYAGVDSDAGASQIKLTLGQIRTIQVNVMGEVVAPGTYSLSSLSSVFHALYQAGGVNDIGSLRAVKLYRNGKLLRTLDIYSYILEGKMTNDVNMTDGDVIIVPPYISLVNISGNIKRPMFYEMLSKESLATLITYAGGFKGNAYKKKINVLRETGNENQIFTIDESEFDRFTLQDGDSVKINPGLDLFENRVEIKGAVFREGYYEIGQNITTVKQLIVSADGVRGDAFLNRAILTRQKEDLTIETIAINIRDLLYNDGNDIALRKNDILYIPSINDLKEYGDFVIHGEIARPGYYKYSDNTTLEDVIIEAGGLLESASTVRVDIARRIIDPSSITVNRTLSENFSFELKGGFVVDGEQGFVLKPYDQIYVRRSPGYHEQKNVNLDGEVLFPGAYALNKKAERISDVIKRAGNLTADAYGKGARLVRMQTEDEKFRQESVLKVASQGVKDSISVKSLDLASVYNVGIELDKAIAHPGSDYDLVLRAGDRIIIPEYNNTVKINGAVMYPNTVVYKKGEKLPYYINQAGGYSDKAKKNKSFVIYMNGTVTKANKYDPNMIQPGAEIIIPTKEQSKKMSMAEIVSLGASVTSMASVVALLIHNIK